MYNGKNFSKSIIEGICFYNELSIENSVGKDKCRSEHFF